MILAAVEMPIGSNTNLTAVYRTEDGGTTWTAVLPLYSATLQYFRYGTAVCLIPAMETSPTQRYITTVYKSLDAGKTWAHINGTGTNILPSTNVRANRAGYRSVESTTVYAGIQDTSTAGLLGLSETTDGGANWVKLRQHSLTTLRSAMLNSTSDRSRSHQSQRSVCGRYMAASYTGRWTADRIGQM